MCLADTCGTSGIDHVQNRAEAKCFQKHGQFALTVCTDCLHGLFAWTVHTDCSHSRLSSHGLPTQTVCMDSSHDSRSKKNVSCLLHPAARESNKPWWTRSNFHLGSQSSLLLFSMPTVCHEILDADTMVLVAVSSGKNLWRDLRALPCRSLLFSSSLAPLQNFDSCLLADCNNDQNAQTHCQGCSKLLAGS